MRARIESAFEVLGRLLYKHAVWVIAAVLLLIAVGATWIPTIEIKTSSDDFLHPDDPVRLTYDSFLDEFGRDDTLIIAIEPPEVFDLAFLEKLRALHEELEDEVPHVREVQSLVSARNTRGENDELIVGELLEDWPSSAEELANIREIALANPLYSNLILSPDARLTTIAVELEAFSTSTGEEDVFSGFDDGVVGEIGAGNGSDDLEGDSRLSGEQEREAVESVLAILERYQAPDFELFAAGGPAVNTLVMTAMISNVAIFTVLSVLVIAILLSVVLRRVAGVFVPMTVAILSVIATIGLMGVFGIPAMPVSELVPSFLLCVGVGGPVHLLVIFFQRLGAGASKEDALAGALRHSGLPIAMTSLTTAGGLVSFAAAELVPIAVFGVVAPMGVIVTMLLTLVLGPSLIAVCPVRVAADPVESRPALSYALLTQSGVFATRNATVVLGAAAGLMLLAGIGIAQLRVSNRTLDWFPDDEPVKVATEKIDAELGGSMVVEVLVDTGSENGLHEPALLAELDRVQARVAELRQGEVWVGKALSIVDVIKEIHVALNEGRTEAYVIPEERRLIAQELLLFENSGSDDLEDFVDPGFQVARITMKVPHVDGSAYLSFGEGVASLFGEALGDHATVTVTGLMTMMSRSWAAAIETITSAYVIALVVITVLMTLVLGSLRLGLLAMIPNLLPIVLTLGLMGGLGVHLDMFSLLIGSIALGLAVDDTIHFMHGFRRCYEATGDVEASVRETLQTTGQALLFTSIVLALGFFIYVFSTLSNLTSFGLLTAFAIAAALLADILVAPALMSVAVRHSSLVVRAGSASHEQAARATG